MRERRTENLNIRITPTTRGRLLDLVNELNTTQGDLIEELIEREVTRMTGKEIDKEKRYIVMMEHKKRGDSLIVGRYLTLETANKEAEDMWKTLVDADKKNNNITVYSEEGYYQDGEWMSDEPLSDIPDGAMNTANPNQVRNIIEAHKGVAEVEVYKYTGGGTPHFHTDSIQSVDDYDLNDEALLFGKMDEETYDKTILANASPRADFAEWYDDEDAEVLCILIK